MVGSTTLEPGETTALELPLFMGMHEGMEGPHRFLVEVRSNDPVEPVQIVEWLFEAGNGQLE